MTPVDFLVWWLLATAFALPLTIAAMHTPGVTQRMEDHP